MLTETTIAALASGRGAIITGGASGIGLATARQLARFGMRVCIVDRDPTELAAAARQLTDACRGGASDVLALEADVASTTDLDRVADAAFGHFANVAFLMNNAA